MPVRPPKYPELAAEIARTGIPKYKIAADAGMPPTVLAKILGGHLEPNAGQRARLAHLMKRSESHLFVETTAARS